jgi:hypothetical protein
MSEPFNKAAREASLKVWESRHETLAAALGIGRILRDGNMDDHNRLRVLVDEVESFVEDLKEAMETLDEEDG